MNGERISKQFIKRLSQFYPQPDELQKALNEHMQESETLAQLFYNLTYNRGKGKSHISGQQDGDVKNS